MLHRIDYFSILFLVLFGIIFYKDIIFGTWIIPWDIQNGHYPIAYQMFLSFSNFEFPLWNPSILGGLPWISYVENAAFYPPHYVIMGLSFLYGSFPYYFLEIVLISHVILAGILMYFFISRSGLSSISSLIGSIIFMFGAFFLINGSHLGIVESMAWTPLIFLLAKRALINKKSWIPVFIPLTLSFLAGHPPTFFVIILCLFFYIIGMSIYRNKKFYFKSKNLLMFFFVGIISLGISSVFLLPVIEFHFFESIHKGVEPTGVGFPPAALLTFLIPSVYGASTNFGLSDLQYWAPFERTWSYMYLGIFPLILVSISAIYLRYKFEKEYFIFLIIGFFALLESISNLTSIPSIFPSIGVGSIIRQYVFFGMFQFSFAYLGAKGFEQLRFFKLNDLFLKKIILPIILIGVLSLGVVTILLLNSDFPIENISETILGNSQLLDNVTNDDINKIIQNLIFNLVVTISFLIASFLIVLYFLKKRESKFVILVILLFVGFDLAFFGMNSQTFTGDSMGREDPYNRISPYIEFEKDFLEFFYKDDLLYRIDVNAPGTRWGGKTVVAMVQDIQIVRGGNPNYLKNHVDFMTTNNIFYGFKEHSSDKIDINSKAYDYFNVKYLISKGYLEDRWPGFDKNRWNLVWNYNAWHKIYENKQVMDRAFVINELVIVDGKEKVREILKDAQFDPQLVLITTENELSTSLKNELLKSNVVTSFPASYSENKIEGKITITDYNFNSIKIHSITNKDGFLILADNYYPGWKAKIDGSENEVFEANLALRAIFLPQGEHKVEFYFDPISVKIGIILSSITAVALSWYGIKTRLRKYQ